MIKVYAELSLVGVEAKTRAEIDALLARILEYVKMAHKDDYLDFSGICGSIEGRVGD